MAENLEGKACYFKKTKEQRSLPCGLVQRIITKSPLPIKMKKKCQGSTKIDFLHCGTVKILLNSISLKLWHYLILEQPKKLQCQNTCKWLELIINKS